MYQEQIKVKGHPDFQMPLKIEIGIESVKWGNGNILVALRGVTPLPNSTLAYWVTGLEMEEYDTQKGFSHDCLFELEYDDAKRLMDDLWFNGIRPSNDEGNEGALSATKNHLEDMRTLVFDKGE